MGDIPNRETVARDGRPDRLRLFELASEQGGYFTAEQAHACGYDFALLSYHAKAGRFIRVRRGLYRFREYPSWYRDHVLAAWLAAGKEIALVSHESALELLDLSDVIPSYVHLTVPRSKRHHPSIWGVKFHTTTSPIQPKDRTYREYLQITSATRSILDAAEYGTEPAQIELAVYQAVNRGLALPERLLEEARQRNRRVAALVERSLRRVGE